jgi:hypothetical protein
MHSTTLLNVLASAITIQFSVVFYNHTTINFLMPKHLPASVNQSLIPEKYNKQQGRSQRTLPLSNSFYKSLDFQSSCVIFQGLTTFN